MKTLRMLLLALMVAGVGMTQETPKITVIPLYFNRASCIPQLGPCRQYVMVMIESQDVDTVAFRTTISYIASTGKVLSQTNFSSKDSDGMAYAIFYHVDDITLKGVVVIPLQAGTAVSIP